MNMLLSSRPLPIHFIHIGGFALRPSKINSIHIDFDSDNILPELNEKDLAELGKESRPVLLKKEILARNLERHSEVKKEDYETIISGALYNGDLKFKGKSGGHNPNYINCVKLKPHDNFLVLLELAEHKEYFEVIHLFKLGDNSLERMQRKK
jgi:hypothetical protein